MIRKDFETIYNDFKTMFDFNKFETTHEATKTITTILNRLTMILKQFLFSTILKQFANILKRSTKIWKWCLVSKMPKWFTTIFILKHLETTRKDFETISNDLETIFLVVEKLFATMMNNSKPFWNVLKLSESICNNFETIYKFKHLKTIYNDLEIKFSFNKFETTPEATETIHNDSE